MRLIFSILLVLFCGCSSVCTRPTCGYISRFCPGDSSSAMESAPMVDVSGFCQVIIPYAVELNHTRRLRFEDSQIYFDTNVKRVRIIFSTQEILELCPARELMVDVVEGFLERLNTSEDVQRAFDHSPITASDLELYFSFESFGIEYVDPLYIAWMSLHDGLVRFYDGLLKDFNKDFWNQRVEPYSKSFEFVTLERAAEEQWEREHPIQKSGPEYHSFE